MDFPRIDKGIILCIAIPLVIFVAVQLLRVSPPGVDGYAFMYDELPGRTNAAVTFVFSLIPKSFLARQIIQMGLMMVFLYGTYLLGKKLCKRPMFAVLAVLFTPVFFMRFAELENEQFGYIFIPFIWLAYYYLSREPDQRRAAFKSIGLILLIGAGFIMWEGLAILAIAFIPASIITFFFFGAAVFLFNSRVLQGIKANQMVMEMETFAAVGHLFLLLPGLLALPFDFLFPVAAIFIFAMINASFAIVLLPILAVGMVCAVEKLKPEYFVQVLKWRLKLVPVSLFCMITGIAFMFNIAIIYMAVPVPEQYYAVQETIAYADGQFVNVDWDYYHWHRYYGGNSTGDGGCCPVVVKEGLVLTKEVIDCDVVKTFKYQGRDFLRLYSCPEKPVGGEV